MTQFKSIRLCALMAASLTALAATANHAVAQTPDPAEMIARADANGDGDITWEEVTALRSATFDQMDRNGDGVVSADDSPAARPLAARFQEALARLQSDFDSDRDGQITKDEMLNAPGPLFEQGDVNDDGVLSADEMAAIRAQAPTLQNGQ